MAQADAAIAVDAVVDDVTKDDSVVTVGAHGLVIRQISEDDLNCDIVLRYQAMAAKAFKQSKGGDREILAQPFVTSLQWLMMQLFTVNHQPLTIDHLTGKPKSNPKCVGLRAIALMNKIAQDLVTELPVEGKD
ncbi:MAG: hypothetical protein AAF528_01220 [Cyanobacteria bacterium P01_C01_bin.121]